MKIKKYISDLLSHSSFYKYKCFFYLVSIIAVFQPSQNIHAAENLNQKALQAMLSEPGIEFTRIDNRDVVKGSLKSTLKLVLQASSQLRSSTMSEEIATSVLFASENKDDPTLSNSATINQSTSASANLSGDSSPYLSFNKSESTTLSTTWNKKVFNGINYSASFSNSISQSRSYSIQSENDALEGGDTRDDPLNSSSLTFGMSIPIYQDWGDVNKILIYRNQIRLNSSKVNTDKTVRQILNTFGEIYWDLSGLWETQKVLKEAINLSEQLLEENKLRLEVGIIKFIDVKQSEIQLLRNQQSLLQIENQIRLVEDQVKVVLNLRNSPIGFLPSDKPQQQNVSLDFDELLKKVYNNSTDLAVSKDQIIIKGYDLKEALNNDEPNIDFSINYTIRGFDKDLASSFDQYSQSELHGYQLGLTWTIPLGNHNNTEAIKQKKIERAQLEIQDSLLKDQLYVDLKSLQRNLNFANNDIKNTQTIRQLNKEILDQEIEKQKLGKSTGFQVAQAQQELISAQSDEIQSLIRYEKLYLSLLIITGDIFVQYEIPRSIENY